MIMRYVIAFVASMVVTTLIIQWLVPFLRSPEQTAQSGRPSGKKIDLMSLGFWIGFFETLLVFMFVAQKEFGALAIIMAAKEFVRKEKIAGNAAYYLLGTLINLAIAVLFALIAGSHA